MNNLSDIARTECSCEICVSGCLIYPGWMTPEEASKAINSGLANRLMKDWYVADGSIKETVFVLAPASMGSEGKDAPDDIFLFGGPGRCTFLKNNLCEIHTSDFKPIQCATGNLCDENTKHINKLQIAKLWQSDLGDSVIRLWEERVKENERS